MATALIVTAAACGGATTTETSQGVASATTGTPTTTAPEPATTLAAPTTSTMAATTTTLGGPALSVEDGAYTIVWEALPSTPFYAPAAAGSADPFFHIHTNPTQDGFFLGFELYTTGYGALWEGELGMVDILCAEAVPGPNSTGICVHFSPGDSEADLNADFQATGSVTINQLDEDGYDIVVDDLVFSNGATVVGLHMTG